jgi:Ca-activated chloride channel family protein
MLELFHNFQLLRPLWLLALVPGALVWWLLRRNRDPLRHYQGLIAPHLLSHLVIGEQQQGFWHPLRVFPLVGLLLIMALAGPSWRREPPAFAEQQAGLMVLLKASRSMDAEDLSPNRMERAVFKLRDLLTLRGAEPAGLIAYSGSAHLVMPLTQDTRIIELMADGLGPEVMPLEGDRLDQALALARRQLEDRSSPGSILVIADGIDDARAEALSQFRSESAIPVQILALAADPRSARQAVAQGAQALDASVVPVTIDDQDIRDIVSGARRRVAALEGEQAGSRPRDEGYLLVPLITILIALWARRGWSLRWPRPALRRVSAADN